MNSPTFRKAMSVDDISNPQGEEKRIVATLKSFGGRNKAYVQRTDWKTSQTEEDLTTKHYHGVEWHSDGGMFTDRRWSIQALFDENLQSPNSVFYMDVTGSDGEWYRYELPRRLLDRYIAQRLGNDYIETLRVVAPSLYTDLGGKKQGDLYVLPTGFQWAVGQVAFQLFREEIQSRHAEG